MHRGSYSDKWQASKLAAHMQDVAGGRLKEGIQVLTHATSLDEDPTDVQIIKV